MSTEILSDGMGNWERASTNKIDKKYNDDAQITDEVLSQNRNIIEARNTFKDLPTHIEAKKIPDAFSNAFNKILEVEHEGITYRYKELNFMELLAHGQNPYSLELTRLAAQNPDKEQEDLLKRV